MDPAACAELVLKSLNTNNQIRQQAEEQIALAKEKCPDQLLLSLCIIAKEDSSPPDVRLLCLIILRRTVVLNRLIPTPYEQIKDSTKEQIKNHVLDILRLDLPNPYKGHVIDLVGNLAASVISQTSNWNDLIQLLAQWTQSTNDNQRESALKIFTHLVSSKAAPESFYESLSSVYINGLSDSSANIRLASLEGSLQFMVVCKEFKQAFKASVPNAFELVTACLNNNQEEVAANALDLLIQLSEIAPDTIEPYLSAVLDICLKIASQPSLDESVRHPCLEIVVTLGENKPRYLRSNTAFLHNFISLLLKMMSMISDSSDWNRGEEYDAEDEEREIGNSYLDRLALSIHAPILAVLFNENIIPAMLKHEDWKVRHTALIAISLVGEGCRDVMKENLDQVMQYILPSFRDPHERVRWAACNTIGQMSTDFAPLLQKRYHQQIINSIVMLMGDTANPRVQSYAAAAVINFCEDCKPKILHPYLEPLLSNLCALLRSHHEIVVEQAIIATAAIAECVGSQFTPYYGTVIPLVIPLLNGRGTVDSLKIRGKAIEGVALIASAVGFSVFQPHCQEVMELLLQLENANLPIDDPRTSLLQRSWGRFSKALGRDFAPYLKPILPRILKSAALEADVKLLTEDQKEDDAWQLIQLDKQNTLGINTAVIQEKHEAITLLYWLAYELKELFYPHIQDILPICIDALSFFYHDTVRMSAASIIPCLLRATFAHSGNYQEVQILFRYVLPNLLGSIENELEPDVLLVFLDALQECFGAAGPNSLQQDEINKFLFHMEKILEHFSENRKVQIHRLQSEDGAEFAQKELEKQHEILVKVAEVVGKSLEVCSAAVLKGIRNIYQCFNELLRLNEFDAETQISVCFWDDLVEFGGEDAAPLYKPWTPYIVGLMRHPNSDVRQSVVYGLGVLAQMNPEVFCPVLGDVLHGLNGLISMEGSRSDENINVTENAISAMGKIIQFHGSVIDVASVLPVWLSYLPATEDDETSVIYKQLCIFMMNHSAIVLGADCERLPHVLNLLAEIYGSSLIEDETNPRIAGILKEMQSKLPPEKMQSAFQSLSPPLQEKLKQICS